MYMSSWPRHSFQPMSRRVFLASSAAILVAACSGQSSTDGTTAAVTTEPLGDPPTTTATVAPSPTTIAATTTTMLTPTAIALPGDPFTLGVASGDPDLTSVVLWTRLAPSPLEGGAMPDEDVEVLWEISNQPSFDSIAAAGFATAAANHGHSVHAIVDLDPGTWYYRFRVDAFTSAVGTTRAAPKTASTATFATASCQNYEAAYFHAHRDIAERSPDFVVWLGDYIYEGAAQDVVGAPGNVRTHGTDEPRTLQGYRDRYALYKLDENLQASHACCPWFVIWDDHEVENNYAGLTPQDSTDQADFAKRRAQAYQAWWEHMPVRLDPPSSDPAEEYQIFRSAQWGELIGLVLLDGRQYRSDQSCGDVALSFESACEQVNDPARTMLGSVQEAFVADTFGQQGTTWNVLAQQTVMTDLTVGPIVLNFDQWDGYPAARSRLTSMIAQQSVPNAVVLTGDIHLAGVAIVRDGVAGQGTKIAVEFVATSISSDGNVGPELAETLRDFPDIVDADLDHRGYILHTVTSDTWTADYFVVLDAKAEQSTVQKFATYQVAAGTIDAQIIAA